MKTMIALALLASSTAAAQTLEVTSGSMTIQAFSPDASFSFSGNGFSGSGDFLFGYDPVATEISPLAPGDYNASISSPLMLQFNGVASEGQAVFSGGAQGIGAGVFTGIFSFAANSNGTYIEGGGDVAMTVVPSAEGYFQVTQAVYTFQPDSVAVPEPGTLGLLALGLAGLARRRVSLVIDRV